MLLSPDLDGFAQGHVRHQGDWQRQHCPSGWAQIPAPGQPPLNVPPFIPAQDSLAWLSGPVPLQSDSQAWQIPGLLRGCGKRARLAGGEHDRVPEQLEGDGAEEAFGRPRLHGCCVQIPLAEAAVPCVVQVKVFNDPIYKLCSQQPCGLHHRPERHPEVSNILKGSTFTAARSMLQVPAIASGQTLHEAAAAVDWTWRYMRRSGAEAAYWPQ